MTVDLVSGSLEMLILRALTWGPLHGYAVARWVEGASGQSLSVEEGSLYPALHRLEARELIESEWGTSENKRRARYYQLTDTGRAYLQSQQTKWSRLVETIDRVMTSDLRPATGR